MAIAANAPAATRLGGRWVVGRSTRGQQERWAYGRRLDNRSGSGWRVPGRKVGRHQGAGEEVSAVV